jgi:excisionase family DNA binding protein
VRESVHDDELMAIDADRAARVAVEAAMAVTDQLRLDDAADVRRSDATQRATASGPRLLLTVREAAHALGMGRSTACELIHAVELEVVHIGRACRVPVAVVEAYVERLRRPRDSTTRLAVRPHA